MTQETAHIETGRHSANKVAFDPSGNILSIASNSGDIKFATVQEAQVRHEIKISEESCQAVLFDRSGEFLVASGNGMNL
jgi:hypothetical protein